MSEITFQNKVERRTTSIPEVNKVTASNMNEIKNSVNALYTGVANTASDLILSADILTGWDTPVEVIPAPGADKLIIVKAARLLMVQNSARYGAAQDQVEIGWGTSYAKGIAISNLLSQATNILGDINGIGAAFNTTYDPSAEINKGINIRFGNSANPTGGDDDLKYYIEYSIIDFSTIT